MHEFHINGTLWAVYGRFFYSNKVLKNDIRFHLLTLQISARHLFKTELLYLNYKMITAIINKFKNKKLFAIAGIAHPENFFQILEKNKLKVEKKLIFPDHYKFTKNEIQNIIRNAKLKGLEVIMTEKDFFKVNNFAANSKLSNQIQMVLILRSAAISIQLLLIFFVNLVLTYQLPWTPLFSVIALELIFTLVSFVFYRHKQQINQSALLVQICADILFLSLLLFFSGGATNAFVSLLLIQQQLYKLFLLLIAVRHHDNLLFHISLDKYNRHVLA